MIRIKKYEDNLFAKVREKPLFFFLIPLFFFLYVDSMLSYYFPVITERSIMNNSLLGLIMAVSSVVGLFCDLIFPSIFSKKTWGFFVLSGILCAFSFPITTYLAIENNSVFLFFIAGIVWGIYFELFQFGVQTFVVTFESKKYFTRTWSLILLIWGLGTATGPILGSELINKNTFSSLITFLLFQSISLITVTVLIKSQKVVKSAQIEIVIPRSQVRMSLRFFKEFQYWEVLITHIWPAILLGILYSTLDATFWIFGGIVGENLFGSIGLGWLILFLFNIPDLINSAILSRFSITTHKKFYSQVCLAFAAILLIFIPLFKHQKFMIAFIILISSFFFSTVNVFASAVFSDLEERAGNFEIYVSAINRSTFSIGYILGPLVAGFFADKFGYLNMFAIMGGIIALCCFALMLITPKKLKLPKKKLNTISVGPIAQSILQ